MPSVYKQIITTGIRHRCT